MSPARRQDSIQNVQELDDSPPPYTPNPTDELTLEVGPRRPFQPPPQQPPQRQRPSLEFQQQTRQDLQPPGGLSDFARDFYAAGHRPSRSLGSPPIQPPPEQPRTQNQIADDGRPTRTPVPGHPLLNNGKTLVYPFGYECSKCLSTFSL